MNDTSDEEPTMLCRNCGASGAELEGACLEAEDGFHDAFRSRDSPAPKRAPDRTPAEMVRDAVRVATAKVAAIYHPRAELDEHQKNAIRRHLEREVDAVLGRFPSPTPQFELPLAGQCGMETETTQGVPSLKGLRGILKVGSAGRLDRTITVGDREYKLTCTGTCPEQYDVSLGGQAVAYLRLRHSFTAQVPDAGGAVVYAVAPDGDGEFSCETERTDHLRAAIVAVDSSIPEEPPPERAE